ncbi:4a-hydroxytetrahydrobiopterin dehydratase [Streptomyces sp. SID3212]|uniref:4a-hydroxytetrahydrobiopterin dehydratase n=1 Tax=Streptomyces sp. SID3212 TaxID=2690259 RepID=UPI00136F2FC5|nr:4a-hydroxytetrahydrobiopterin dehydratase [Streptomyces sp. SID3212]MYV52055.1 4a-hydroxytetrahydrobiopterin dehydratase [Streptomyces sp. SID3212]
MPTEPLSPQETEDRLGEVPGWSLENGRITRTYHLGSHRAAAAMVAHVAVIQDELNHHSDLTLGYDTVSLTVSTHDAGDAVTGLDLDLARRVEDIAPAHGAN